MRIKVINPNTTAGMTATIADAAERAAAPGTVIVPATSAMGPVSIEGHYDEAIAVVGLLDAVRQGEADAIDGYVVACFGDPGLQACREIARGPVVGIAEAAMHCASLVAHGFAIVTTLGRTVAIAEHLVLAYGFERQCRSIRASDIAVLDLEDPASDARQVILRECRAAIEHDGAGAILLGCAGMADLARDLGDALGVPVIDGVAAAVKLVEALVGLGLATSKRGPLAYPLPKTYTGALAHMAPGPRADRR